VAIAFRSIGALTFAGNATLNTTTTSTPNLPTGAVSTDRIYILAVSTGTISTPASWTSLLASTSLGGGSTSDFGGTRFLTVFYRDYDGVWTMPSLSVAANASLGAEIAAGTMAFSLAGTEQWDAPNVGSGSDTTSGTSYSVTTAAMANPTGAIDIVFWGFPSGPGSISAQTVTATGLTVGTITSQHASSVGVTGGDCGIATYTAPVTTGVASQAHTIAATGTSADTTGIVLVVQTVSAAPSVTIAKDHIVNRARFRTSLW
jgi:hypothetical protein